MSQQSCRMIVQHCIAPYLKSVYNSQVVVAHQHVHVWLVRSTRNEKNRHTKLMIFADEQLVLLCKAADHDNAVEHESDPSRQARGGGLAGQRCRNVTTFLQSNIRLQY